MQAFPFGTRFRVDDENRFMLFSTFVIEGPIPGPHAVITGGVHGDEFEPMSACRRLIRELSPERIRGRITIAPVVNEPAFWRGHRTAEDEKDLARTCPGRPDGTITERIAHDLSQLIRSADCYIDLHTGGTRLMVLPLSGYTMHPNPVVLEKQRRMSAAFGLPLAWGADPNLPGRSLSIARQHDIPAIYAEFEGGARRSSEGIEAYVRGCRNVLIEFGILDEAPEPAPSPVFIEDARPNAGFLQINQPSPCDGFFTPAKRLGDYIEAGEPFGAVSDILGVDVVTVPAAKTGMVLVLHTFPTVRSGDSLGVVIEMDRDQHRVYLQAASPNRAAGRGSDRSA